MLRTTPAFLPALCFPTQNGPESRRPLSLFETWLLCADEIATTHSAAIPAEASTINFCAAEPLPACRRIPLKMPSQAAVCSRGAHVPQAPGHLCPPDKR